MARSRNRDIATILGRTEAANTTNVRIQQLGETIDSGQVSNVAIQKFTALDSLPSTDLQSGQRAWIESSGRLYISNGSGWYNVALVNISPVLTLDQSGTILLDADTLTATVTCTGVDSDAPDPLITFSVESDGNMVGTGTSVSQDSSVFTITALSSDSGGTAGDFTLTFKATDGIGVDNEALSFTLTFSNVVDSSAETILLMKAAGNSANNASITFLDSDGSAGVGYNENGDPQASTFTPYRSGGYSAYFDGTGDYASADLGAHIGSGDFTVECWAYIDKGRSTASRGIFQISNTSGGLQSNATTNLMVAYRNSSFSYNWVVYANSAQNNTSTASVAGKWTHVALVRSGSTTKLYIDGSEIESISDSTNYNATRYVAFGGYYGSSNLFHGYIRDLRVVKGTAVYTSTFTPPTEALTAISGTELLTAHLPYFGDGSTNDLTITLNGNAHTEPFGPYDYEPWNDSDHGGSVNFDGSDSLKVDGSPTWPNFGTGAFTVECWVYQPTIAIASLVTVHRQAVASGWYLSVGNASGNPNWGSYGNGNNSDNTSSGAIVAGMWNHIAMVRTSTSANGSAWYINGKAAGTFTDTSNYASYTYGPWIGSNDTSGGNQRYFIGNIADVRVSNSAVYSAEFTPPTAPLTATANTVHLMNNKNDAKIYDLAAANSIQVSGSVTNTSTRKFTTSSSVYFDGSNDVLTIPSSPQIILGSSDFTLEGWFYPEDITPPSGLGTIASIHTGDNTGWYFSLYQSKWRFQAYSSLIFNSGSNATQDAWSHVAITRSGNNYTMWVNGTSSATATDSTSWTGTVDLTIGYSHSSYYQGYIQDFRLTKGLARYTAAFTAPTAEFEL